MRRTWKGCLVVVLCAALVVSVRLWWVNRDPNIVIPNPKPPSLNAFTYYVEAGKMLPKGDKAGFALDTTNNPLDKHTPYTLADRERIVAENADALAELREGFKYPYVEPPVRSIEQLLPHFAWYRDMAKALELEGMVKGARGDWAGLFNSDLDAMEMGVNMTHGTMLLGGLVSNAVEGIARQQMWENVGRLNATQAAAAADRLEKLLQRQEPLWRILAEEKWVALAGEKEIFEKPSARIRVESNSEQGLLTTARDFGDHVRLLWTGKRTVLLGCATYYDGWVENAKHRPGYRKDIEPLSDPVSNEVLAELGHVLNADDKNQAENLLLLTTLRLRAFRLTHGKYPESLSELGVPIPEDPFARSGPLKYRREGIEYVLYSVGPDGKDDGGRPIRDPDPRATPESMHRVQPDSKGDIVAGVNTR